MAARERVAAISNVREAAIEAGLELLRTGQCDTIAAAARNAGVPRQTLSDHWNKETAGVPDFKPDGLDGDHEPQVSEIPVFRRTYDAAEHYVYPLGDVHKGAPAHQHHKWRKWLDYLTETEDVSMLGTGDFLNCALKTSVSDVYEEAMTVKDAKWQMADELKPLAEKDTLDILIPGNHELRVTKATGECPVYDIARSLGVNYSATAAVIVYEVGDVVYTAYVVHGKGGGQVGARANRLKKQALTIQADVYVSGHTHSQLSFPDEFYSVDTESLRVVRNKQMFVSSGSFLAMEDYAAISGFSPTHMGAPRIRLDGRRKDVRVSI